jgi:hypothetical protein
MSRSTHFHYLTAAANTWLEKNCKKEKVLPSYEKEANEALENFRKQYPSITSADMQTFILGYKSRVEQMASLEFITTQLDPVTGMFNEEVYTLLKYETYDGLFVEEFVQAEPWSSGPHIFLALRFVNPEHLEIQESLWSEEEMDLFT